MRTVSSRIVLLLAALTLPFYPRPVFALRATAFLEGNAALLAGMEEKLKPEEPKKLVQAALDRIKHADPATQKLFQGISIHGVPGKGIRVEGETIYLGIAPGRDEKILAQCLIWAATARRAVQTVRLQADKLAASEPTKSLQLLSVWNFLHKASIHLHTGESTTIFQSKVHLKVGAHVGLKEMVRDLIKAGGALSRGEQAKEQAVLLGKSADDLAFDLWKDGEADVPVGSSSEAWTEGAAAAQADVRKQVQEPSLDQELLSGVRRYASSNPDGLTGAWRSYADQLGKMLRLNDHDRQTQFLEQLLNVYGFVHYSERSGDEDAASQASALNSASESAELLARSLVDYLNDPFLGERGDRTQQELLAELAQGIHVDNLLSYLRFGHMPMYLSAKISKPMVSSQIAQERMNSGEGSGKAASPLALTLKGTVHGLLTSGPPSHRLLALAGPAAADEPEQGPAGGLNDYMPRLPADAGYRLGATGLIEEWQEAVSDADTLDRAMKRLPSGIAGNLELALSRRDQQTDSGTDELSEMLLFLFSIGSSKTLQGAWRPFLKDLDLPALSREQGRSQEELAAALFVWQAVYAYLINRPDATAHDALLNSLAGLGKSKDKIFRFIADFYLRFEQAERGRAEVEAAAAQEREAQLAAGKADKKRRRKEKAQKEWEELGIPLAAAPGAASADARLLNAATLEGFIYRLHQLDLSDSQVRMLDSDKGAAEPVMTALIGGHGEGTKALKKAWRGLIRSVHADVVGESPPKYLEGNVGERTIAAELYVFLEPFGDFPGGRWWEKGKIGSTLKRVKEALPDFNTARAEQESARAEALEQRMRKLEEAMESQSALIRRLLLRVDELERRAGIPSPLAETAGVEEQDSELLPIQEFIRRFGAAAAFLDLDLSGVRQAVVVRSPARQVEAPVWTVRLYYSGDIELGEALKRRVAAVRMPGLRFVVAALPPQGPLERPGVVLSQGPLSRELGRPIAVVGLPSATAEAVSAIASMDPELLAAAAYEPRLEAAVFYWGVQTRTFQDEQGNWFLSIFL